MRRPQAAGRGLDSEGCGQRTIVRRRRRPARIRNEGRRVGRADLVARERDGVTVRVRRDPALGALLDGNDAAKRVVLTVVRALDTRRARVVVVVAIRLSRGVRIAPCLAEQRDARSSRESQNDRENDCSKHDGLTISKARMGPLSNLDFFPPGSLNPMYGPRDSPAGIRRFFPVAAENPAALPSEGALTSLDAATGPVNLNT